MTDSLNWEMGQFRKRKDTKQLKISIANAVPWPLSWRPRLAQIQEDLTARAPGKLFG